MSQQHPANIGLISALALIAGLPAAQKALVLGAFLDRRNHALLSALRAEAVHEVATRDRDATYATAAQELGVSKDTINKAITAHRRAMKPADGSTPQKASRTVAELLLQHATATGSDDDWQVAQDALRAAGYGSAADSIQASRAEGRRRVGVSFDGNLIAIIALEDR